MTIVPKLASAAITLLLMLLAASPAGAADWRDGGPITDLDRQANGFSGTTDASTGEAAFSWSGYADAPPDQRPLLRRRVFGEPLGNPRALLQESASVEVDAAGGEVLATLETPIAVARQVIAQSFVGGTLTATIIVEATGDERICARTTALGANGRAIVVYGISQGGDTPPPGTRCTLFARVRAERGQDFGPPTQLGDTARFSGSVSAALDADGRGYVTWFDELTDRVNARRYEPASGFAAPPEILNVVGENPIGFPIQLGVAPTGRAVVVFPSVRPAGGIHVVVATGDTRTGFAPTEIVSGPAIINANYGIDLDSSIGEDGTIGVVWRAGRDARARIQGLVANPTELVSAEQTEALSDFGARGPRVAVAGGRATFAWFRLISGVGRSIESSFGRASDGIGSARRISRSVVAAVPPAVVAARSGATWISWGANPREISGTYSVQEAVKLSFASNSYSRVLDVLRARTNIGEFLSPPLRLLPTRGDAMLAAVARQRGDSTVFFQLRSYGE